MKRVLGVFAVCLLLLAALCITSFASGINCDLDELGLEVTIPQKYVAVTRNTPEDHPVFSDHGLSGAAILQYYELSNIYLNAIPKEELEEEIVVTMTEIELNDLNLLSDTGINILGSMMAPQYEKLGITVMRYDVYNQSQTKFLRFYFVDYANSVYGLQYYTIYDGKAINFTMRSYKGGLFTDQEETIKAVVDSVKLDKKPQAYVPGEDTPSFVYNDEEAGVKFTVPANWKQEDVAEGREYIDHKFVSVKEDGCAMVYGSVDIWGEIPYTEKIGYSRADINGDYFTKDEIAEMLMTTKSNVSTVIYNDTVYYKSEENRETTVLGINALVKTTYLMRIDNGWMYTFQFLGDSSHNLYPDFEQLLETVEYPFVAFPGGSTSGENSSGSTSGGNSSGSTSGENSSGSTSGENSSGSTSGGNSGETSGDAEKAAIICIVIVIIFAAVVIIVAVAKRMARRASKRAKANKSIEDFTYAAVVKCKNCGQVLPGNSKFCDMCGTKIER